MPKTHRSFPPETLRLFREWRGLSQEEVGCILDMTANAVQAMEYGEGAPEWVRYTLFGWATVVDGQSPRTAARYLGLPWSHYPLPPGAPPDEAQLAQLEALRTPLVEVPGAGESERKEEPEEPASAASGAGDALTVGTAFTLSTPGSHRPARQGGQP